MYHSFKSFSGVGNCRRSRCKAVGKDLHPFSDTVGVDIVLWDSERILWSELDAVGPKHAVQIWSFISKFVMLDWFVKTLGLAEAYPGIPMAKKTHPLEYLGTATKVTIFLSIQFTVLIFSQDS